MLGRPYRMSGDNQTTSTVYRADDVFNQMASSWIKQTVSKYLDDVIGCSVVRNICRYFLDLLHTLHERGESCVRIIKIIVQIAPYYRKFGQVVRINYDVSEFANGTESLLLPRSICPYSWIIECSVVWRIYLYFWISHKPSMKEGRASSHQW